MNSTATHKSKIRTVSSIPQLKQEIKDLAICGRLLDNEPVPMKGCNFVDCATCTLDVAYYIYDDDVLEKITLLEKQLQKRLKSASRTPPKTEIQLLKELLEAST